MICKRNMQLTFSSETEMRLTVYWLERKYVKDTTLRNVYADDKSPRRENFGGSLVHNMFLIYSSSVVVLGDNAAVMGWKL